MFELNRREFVVGACAACAGSLCLATNAPAAAAEPFEAGAIADYPKDGVYDTYADKKKVLIVRKGKRLTAVSATCTHKGTTLKVVNGEIKCPKHGAKYDQNGVVTKGPAKNSLNHFAISLDNGKLKIDPSKSFSEKQRDDEGAFVEVK